MISANVLVYSWLSSVVQGGVSWGLRFKCNLVPFSELSGPDGGNAPVKSPAMAGGLCAMNRHYFSELDSMIVACVSGKERLRNIA